MICYITKEKLYDHLSKYKKKTVEKVQYFFIINIFSSVQFSCSVMSDSLPPHGLQHTRLPCPLSTPEAYSNSCPSIQWCHPTISSSVIPFSSHLQFLPASGSFFKKTFKKEVSFSHQVAKVFEFQL